MKLTREMEFKNPLTQNINPSRIASDYKSDLGRAVPTIDVAFVGNLLSDVFGVESPVYLPTWWQGRDYSPETYPGVEMEPDDPEYDQAPVRNGKKTFGAFWLESGTYQFYNNDGELNDKTVGRIMMPLATIVDFSREKSVTKTPVIGGFGTVKEIYGFNDWSIAIKGIIIPDDSNEPGHRTVREQQTAIQKFFEAAGSIDVDGQIFAERNISRIVMEDLNFSPIQGRPNMMKYTISAVSDEDILLTGVR